MTRDTPRYIVKVGFLDDMPKYEFPVQAMNKTKPAASVVIETEQGFEMALLNALAWAETFSTKQHQPVYPKVRYSDSQRMIKRVVGAHAWAENASHGAWVPVTSLSL